MSELLAFALSKYRARGVDRVLITAREDNPASRRVIEKQGGQPDGIVEDRGYQWVRYWVPTATQPDEPSKVNFIWDFDGTLVDSYPGIMVALEETYQHFGLDFDKVAVLQVIMSESVGQLLKGLAKDLNCTYEELYTFYSRQQNQRNDQIILMPFVTETLDWTQQKGIQNFIYTHKNQTTFAVLEDLGISHYFTEVITSANGFERKPHPEGINYLLDKYHLDKDNTYYIGDRQLDVDVAINAGIHAINLTQPESATNIAISDLSELSKLFRQ